MIKTDNKNYLKDPRNGALINTNREAYEEYKRTKKKLQSADIMRSEINSLKTDMQEIKETLRLLTDRIQ